MTGERIDVEALDRELESLHRASQERAKELRSLAEQLPEVTSRRAMVRAMAASLAHAPDRPLVVKRVALKLARLPADAVRRVRTR